MQSADRGNVNGATDQTWIGISIIELPGEDIYLSRPPSQRTVVLKDRQKVKPLNHGSCHVFSRFFGQKNRDHEDAVTLLIRRAVSRDIGMRPYISANIPLSADFKL